MKEYRKQRSIAHILKEPKNELAALIDKVNHLKKLNQHLQRILDPSLFQHCQVANFEDNVLTLVVDNSNWATRIRYLIPDLTEQLKKIPDFYNLKTVRFIVAPKEAET